VGQPPDTNNILVTGVTEDFGSLLECSYLILCYVAGDLDSFSYKTTVLWDFCVKCGGKLPLVS